MTGSGVFSPPAGQIILAVDVPDGDSAMRLLEPMAGRIRWAKIGLQLFVAEGPQIVRKVRAAGFDVFLDLKFYDIPNTVTGAIRSVRELGVGMTTIHLAGGPAMVEAAVEEAGSLLVLGVTVLTSMDAGQLAATGVQNTPQEQVLALAQSGQAVGLRGVVASPREVCALRAACGAGLTIVTPGIRPTGADAGDQSRTASPASARADGADYLVIGRPITAAPDPVAALEAIVKSMAGS
jgi:orotidine-5'-phosphate decarboxylase